MDGAGINVLGISDARAGWGDGGIYRGVVAKHAVGLVIITFIINTQYQRIRVFSLAQQALVVLFLLLIKQVLVLWVSGMVGQAPGIGLYFLPSLTGAIIWPWLFIVLRDLRRRFTVSRSF